MCACRTLSRASGMFNINFSAGSTFSDSDAVFGFTDVLPVKGHPIFSISFRVLSSFR